MYFSKIQLRAGLDLQTLADAIPTQAYAEHKMIWGLFQGAEQRDFLFRREEMGHWPLFYTLSRREPRDSKAIWQIRTMPFQPQLQAGQRLAFMLRANPVMTRRLDDKKHKQDDVVMRAKRVYPEGERPSQAALVQQAGPAWLAERAEGHGFKLDSVRVDDYRRHHFHKPGQKSPVEFSTLDYAGVLEVLEPQAFVEMLCRGLGRAKGFGCGLMLVRRV